MSDTKQNPEGPSAMDVIKQIGADAMAGTAQVVNSAIALKGLAALRDPSGSGFRCPGCGTKLTPTVDK